MREDGTVWTVGKNNYGQLGDETTVNKKSWVCISEIRIKVKETSITINAVGGKYNLAPVLGVGFNLLYDDGADGDFAYASKDTATADVSEKGVITGVKRGKTKIGITETNTEKTIYVDVYVLDEKDVAFPQIVTGESTTVALKADGTVWTWGQNDKGQLGLGDDKNRIAPTKVEIDNVVKIATSGNHTLALKKDGTVWAWGQGTAGQLGTGLLQNSSVPVQVRDETGVNVLRNIKEIATANQLSMAVTEEGKVYAWGLGTSGQIGNGAKNNQAMPTKVFGLSNITKIAGGNLSGYAITDEGEAYSWGYNNRGQLGDGTNTLRTQPVKIPNLTGIIEISAASTDQVIALRDDGTVWGWGYSTLGALTDVGGSTPKQIAGKTSRMKDIAGISAGYYAGLAITDAGKVLSWGTNGFGGLGNGTTTNTAIPTNVMESATKELDQIFIISMGKNYSVYAKEDGSVWATGTNEYGQLGNTSTVTIHTPENISQDYISTNKLELVFNELNVEQPINATYNFGFNLYNNTADVKFTYASDDDTIAAVGENGMVTSRNVGKTYITISAGDLARRVEVNVLQPQEIAVMDAQGGLRHTLALKTNGTLWAFGDNSYGQLGLGVVENATYQKPQEVKLPENVKFTKIAVGSNHNLALDTDGNVYSFGLNANGQLGNNTNANSGALIKVEGLTNIVKIAAYKNSSMALNQDGELFVWGEGYSKQPEKIEFHTKIIDMTGRILLSEQGTVWNMKNLNEKTPILTNIVEIASGDSHNLALKADGTVYGFGANNYGQLGTGNTTNADKPVAIPNLPKVESVKANLYTSIVLTNSGEVYSFGRNTKSSLGQNTKDTYNATPTKIESTKVQRISAGQNFGIYVNDEGFVYSWGNNDYGQLAQENAKEIITPSVIGTVKVQTDKDYITIQEGETKGISATLNNTFNLRKDVIASDGFTYESMNTGIATTQDFRVTGVKEGITPIVISHAASSQKTAVYVEVVRENAKSVIDLKAGTDFNLSLKADGSIWSWGAGAYGKLGVGSLDNHNEPGQIPTTSRTRQIATGLEHIVVLSENGKAYTAGKNGNGQCGNGTSVNSKDLTEILDENGKPLENLVMVSAHGNTTYVLDHDGIVYACGAGYNKVATKVTNIPKIAQISGNYGITMDKKVVDLSTGAEVEKLENIIKIAQGDNHTLFLSQAKTVYSLGVNTNGQGGIGTKTNIMTPTQVKNNVGTGILTNVVDIAAGKNFSMAVLENGTVYTWGSNENHKLGAEQANDQILPRRNTNIQNAILAVAGTNHAAYVANDGRVYAWGNGENGTLGNGVDANSITPVLVGSEEVVVDNHHVTLQIDEETTLQANVKSFNLINDLKPGGLTYQSNDTEIVLVDNTGKLTGVKEGIASITVTQDGTDHQAIVQVAVIRKNAEFNPMVKTTNSSQVILKSDGTVWTYGANENGELGNGNQIASDNLNKVAFNSEVKIKEIAVGENHILALDENGEVWAWGSNTYYQLGKSEITDSNQPIKLELRSKVVKIAAGYNSSYAITEENSLMAWGLNTDGQLGLGNNDNRLLPTKVRTLKNVLDVVAGKSHTVVLTTNGTVYTTGNNSFGSLTGDDYKRNTFKPVENLSNIAYISAGEYHNIALSTKNEVYVWGYNVYGQLGTGNTSNLNTPAKIAIENVKQVSSGRSHSSILTKDGKLYSTGLNSLGQLGTMSKDNQVTFTLVDTIDEVYSIDTGNTYDMAIKNDGTVWAWGDYYHGTTAIRTKSNSRVPVQIGIQNFYLVENDIAINKDTSKQLQVNPQFEFNVFENNTLENNFSYTSLNEEVATVDENGTVTGKKVGTTWVKVTENTSKAEQIAIIRVIEPGNKVAPKVAGGINYAVVLKADGSVWSFGYNSNGQLGDSSFVASKVPKEINILKSYTDITAGDNFTLILKNDGTVWSVGDNQYGQLGLGDRTSRQTPTVVPNLENVVKIAAGSKHSIALTKYGEVYTWGANTNGKLGIGNTDTKDVPVKVEIPGANIIDVAAGEGYIALVDSNGTIYVSGKLGAIDSKVPVAVSGITNAAKVATGKDLIVLTKEGNVVQVGEQTTNLYSNKDAVDIAAKGTNYLILNNSGKLFDGSASANGEIGDVLTIGSGMNNTYYIANSGLVYARGQNQYGSLGNDTTDNSEEYTLVGKRSFTVSPNNILMSTNDIKDIEIISERYNVLKQDNRTINDFDWTSNDTDIVTVEAPAKIKAIAEGETTITVTQKDTGAEVEITVVVEPLEAQRLEKLAVNEVDAQVSGIKKYEVTIATDKDNGSLVITTKDKTDKISIDGGTTWFENGSLTQMVSLPTPVTQIPIKVQTSNGTEFDYTLDVIKQSTITTLESLTVNGTEATAVGGTNYSIVVEDADNATVKAVTTHEKAKVGIDSNEVQVHEATEDLSLADTLIRTVPIKVIAESGKEVNYVLTIYKKSAVTELESVTVDGKEATKNNHLNYSMVVEKDTTQVDVKAIALYDLANVNINNLGAEVKQTTRTITLTGDVTTVKIKVGMGEEEKEYTLTITKKVDGSDLADLFVNGERATKISNNQYEAVVASNSTTAEVLAIAAVNTSKVQIGANSQEVGSSQVTVATPDNNNIYTITITDSEDVSKTATYTLTIKKPSTDNSLKYIRISNNEMSVDATRDAGTDIYRAKINEKYENLTITALANYELAEVAIETNPYQVKQDTLAYTFNTDTATLQIKVKAQDGDEKTYTLILEKQSSDTNLEYVKVNGANAVKSEEKADTYEITLTQKADNVTVEAKTTDVAAEVALNNIVYELQTITKQIAMDAKEITVKINVKAEDGTTKTYDLIIHSVPDNTKLTEVSVNGVTATLQPYSNKYVVRVPSNLSTYAVTAKAEDSLATVKIDNFDAILAQSTQNITKTELAPTKVTIEVTAQDKESKEQYELEIYPRSQDTVLAYLKVDESFVEAADDGQYYVKVVNSTTSVKIEAKAGDENATVGVDSAGTTNIVTTVGNLTGDVTVFDITVTAEDGNTKTYKLNVEKLSNDTSLVGIYVDGNEVTPVDGKYVAKIGNNTSALVKAVATNPDANVSVDGNTDALKENQNTVDVNEEEKTIEITVTAPDGTKKIYPLTLKRNSTDNTLLSISGKDVEPEAVVQTSENTYQMIVSNELTKLELTAVTSSKVAEVKIENNDYEVNTQTKEVALPNDTNTVVITVKAESGEEKQYTVTIIKKYILTLDSITVDGTAAEKQEDGTYIAWVDPDNTQSQVVVTPTSSKVNVKVGTTIDNIGTTTYTVATAEDETISKIIVKSPIEEDQVEYTLKIMKKSQDTTLEYVKVDSQVGTQEDDGSYTVKVPVQDDSYRMEVKTTSPYAQVKIEDNAFALGTDSYTLDLTGVNTKTVTVTVKAQDGTVKAYTVNVQKVSSDNTLQTVKVNNSEITEVDGIYRAFIKEDVTNANLYVETTHSGATIKLGDDDEKVHTVTKDITMDQSEKTIAMKVTAEDGSVKQYTVIIAKESSDIQIQSVKVDGKGAITVDESTYYITATPGATEVEVEVIAANQYADVQINGSSKAKGKNTVKVTLPANQKVVAVPIVITAQNGKDTKLYTLNIEQVSNNTNITKVTVNGKTVTTYDEETKTYTHIIDYSVDEADITVETENAEATVRIEAGAFSKHTATETVSTAGEVNEITITVVAEDGTTENRKLVIKKLSQDASILKLFVNEVDIAANEDGSYTAEVLESSPKATVRIKTTNKDAQILLDGTALETKGEGTKEYTTAGTRKITVPIKVIAEDGVTTKETTLTINIVSDNKNLEYVKVNSNVVTDYDEATSTYKAFIPATATSAAIEVKTISPYATLNIDGNTATQVITYTATTDTDMTYVYVDVIAENDSVKTYTIALQKESTDNTLKDLYKDGTQVDPEEDENYIINVPEDTTSLTVKAIANNEYATVAIGSEAAELKETTKTVTLATGKTTVVNITVTAQNKAARTYTVTINKVSANNNVEYVKVNSNTVTDYDAETKTYEAFIPAGATSASLEIQSENAYATVEVLDTSAVHNVKVTATIEDEETLIPFIVTSETGADETYYIKLTRISTDNTIKEIYVNGTLITKDEDGNYIAEVAENSTDALVKVVANNKYASVQIANGEAKTEVSEETVTLSTDKMTNVAITVTSQSGAVANETLIIKKVSDDTGINTVFVNSIECKNYDATTKTYTAYIGADVDESEVAVMANSQGATVALEDVTGTGNASKTVATTAQTTKLTVTITSETGKTAKYTINIVKESADATVELIKVNDKEVQAPYDVTIKKLDTKAKIYVKATNANATVKIGDETAEKGSSEVTLTIPLEQETIVVPVVVTAQNGIAKETYNITLRRISNNTGIKQILVNGEDVDLTTFEHIVKNVNESSIVIIPEDENATVKLDSTASSTNDNTWKVNTATTTIRTITVTAPDGTEKEYTLTLIKKVTISGTITDDNIVDKHIATVVVYQTDDTRKESTKTDLNGIVLDENGGTVQTNVREIIAEVETEPDGSFEIVLEPGEYDVVFLKPGHLTHRITNIDISKGKGAELETVKMLAGDIVETGEIELDDLVSINEQYGLTVDYTEGVNDANVKYDFNGDGIVDAKDRNILKKNYGKKAKTVKWVDPDEVAKQAAKAAKQKATTKVSSQARGTSAYEGQFILPLNSKYTITSNYGDRIGPITETQEKHTGIDIAGEHHAEVLVVADGEVTWAGVQNGYGNCIEVKHIVNGETIYSFYAHLSEIKVQTGDKVTQGQVIALEGGDPATDPNPGDSTGHHLHFEIRTKSGYGNDVDPSKYINF